MPTAPTRLTLPTAQLRIGSSRGRPRLRDLGSFVASGLLRQVLLLIQANLYGPWRAVHFQGTQKQAGLSADSVVTIIGDPTSGASDKAGE